MTNVPRPHHPSSTDGNVSVMTHVSKPTNRQRKKLKHLVEQYKLTSDQATQLGKRGSTAEWMIGIAQSKGPQLCLVIRSIVHAKLSVEKWTLRVETADHQSLSLVMLGRWAEEAAQYFFHKGETVKDHPFLLSGAGANLTSLENKITFANSVMMYILDLSDVDLGSTAKLQPGWLKVRDNVIRKRPGQEVTQEQQDVSTRPLKRVRQDDKGASSGPVQKPTLSESASESQSQSPMHALDIQPAQIPPRQPVKYVQQSSEIGQEDEDDISKCDPSPQALRAGQEASFSPSGRRPAKAMRLVSPISPLEVRTSLRPKSCDSPSSTRPHTHISSPCVPHQGLDRLSNSMTSRTCARVGRSTPPWVNTPSPPPVDTSPTPDDQDVSVPSLGRTREAETVVRPPKMSRDLLPLTVGMHIFLPVRDIHALSSGLSVAVIGLVTQTSRITKSTSGSGDVLTAIYICDPRKPEDFSGSVNVSLFSVDGSDLPSCKQGDVIAFAGIKTSIFNDKMTLKGYKRCFSWAQLREESREIVRSPCCTIDGGVEAQLLGLHGLTNGVELDEIAAFGPGRKQIPLCKMQPDIFFAADVQLIKVWTITGTAPKELHVTDYTCHPMLHRWHDRDLPMRLADTQNSIASVDSNKGNEGNGHVLKISVWGKDEELKWLDDLRPDMVLHLGNVRPYLNPKGFIEAKVNQDGFESSSHTSEKGGNHGLVKLFVLDDEESVRKMTKARQQFILGTSTQSPQRDIPFPSRSRTDKPSSGDHSSSSGSIINLGSTSRPDAFYERQKRLPSLSNLRFAQREINNWPLTHFRDAVLFDFETEGSSENFKCRVISVTSSKKWRIEDWIALTCVACTEVLNVGERPPCPSCDGNNFRHSFRVRVKVRDASSEETLLPESRSTKEDYHELTLIGKEAAAFFASFDPRLIYEDRTEQLAFARAVAPLLGGQEAQSLLDSGRSTAKTGDRTGALRLSREELEIQPKPLLLGIKSTCTQRTTKAHNQLTVISTVLEPLPSS